MSCKLTIAQFAQRLQQAAFTGPAATAIGALENFTYAASPVVPQGKYWLVVAASVLHDVPSGDADTGANEAATLYLVNNPSLRPSMTGLYGQQKIFGSHKMGTPDTTDLCNWLPVDSSCSVRIDYQISNDVNPAVGVTTPFEQTLIRGGVPLILPQNCFLMVTNATPGCDGPLNAQLTLKLWYALMDQTESVDWF
jgi:hypothetical protein